MKCLDAFNLEADQSKYERIRQLSFFLSLGDWIKLGAGG